MLPVTSITAVALSLAFLWLGIVTIRRRRRHRVAIGDGANEAVARAMRAQANLGEYGLFFLALLGLAEANAAPAAWLGALSVAFLAGRVSHAYGMLVAEPRGGSGAFRFRTFGMMTTLTGIPLAATTLLLALVL